ncbi:MAG: cobalt ECF transporter T component CbiQ [Candidatus Desantisbacteria bacterium]
MELFSEYFKKDHMLSQIDARVKLGVSLAILAMVLSYEGFVLPLFITILCLFLCMKMRIPLRIFVLRFSEPVFIASVIVLLKFFFSGNDVLFSLDIMGINIEGYNDGLMEGLMIASRILGAVSIMIVLGFSMPFTEFMAALSWMRMPKGFVEILMLAYRYIFLLLEDAMVIYHAQKNRLGYSSIRRGMESFGTLTGSLILKAFDHSQHITTAMIQRGYDGNIPMLKHKPFNAVQVIFSILLVIVVGVVWKMQ